jgi:DNA-binding response OmpR family regulator
VTALAMRGDEARAREAGFDDYVTKPVDRQILEETIERLLKRGGGAASDGPLPRIAPRGGG